MIVALGLGLIPPANAGLYLEVNGRGSDILVAPGELVTVKVVQDTPNPTGSGGGMTLTFTGTDITVVNTTPGFYINGGYWNWLFDGGVAVLPNGVWFGKVAAAGVGIPGIGSVNVLSQPYVSTIEFSFRVTEVTDIIWNGTWDGVDMTGMVGACMFPEPMTLALFGFGGLLICHRK